MFKWETSFNGGRIEFALQSLRRTRCYLPARPGAFPLLPRFSIFLIFELFPRLPPVPLLDVSGDEPVAVGAAVDCEGGLLSAAVVEGTVRAAWAANCEGGLFLAPAVERAV